MKKLRGLALLTAFILCFTACTPGQNGPQEEPAVETPAIAPIRRCNLGIFNPGKKFGIVWY